MRSECTARYGYIMPPSSPRSCIFSGVVRSCPEMGLRAGKNPQHSIRPRAGRLYS